MYRFIIILTTLLFCSLTPFTNSSEAQYASYSVIEQLNEPGQENEVNDYDISKYRNNDDISDIIISSWQEYHWFIIALFIALIIIIILGYQIILIKSQNRDILLKLNSRYNHIKNLESDTALLSNILKAVNAKSWVINLDKNEIYYLDYDSTDIKIITGNNIKTYFINYIHPDFQDLFIEKIKYCREKQAKDFDITYPIHRKHAKREYEWFWSRGILTTRRDINGKPYMALSGITINIESVKRSRIDLEKSQSEIKELKDSCRTIRFEISREINETIRTRKQLTKDLASDTLSSSERKKIYKNLRECDKKINTFIATIHKSLK